MSREESGGGVFGAIEALLAVVGALTLMGVIAVAASVLAWEMELRKSEQNGQLADLQRQVERLTEQAATRDGAVAAAQGAGKEGAVSAGLVALTGPGVVITLDDAPARPDAWRHHCRQHLLRLAGAPADPRTALSERRS